MAPELQKNKAPYAVKLPPPEQRLSLTPEDASVMLVTYSASKHVLNVLERLEKQWANLNDPKSEKPSHKDLREQLQLVAKEMKYVSDYLGKSTEGVIKSLDERGENGQAARLRGRIIEAKRAVDNSFILVNKRLGLMNIENDPPIISGWLHPYKEIADAVRKGYDGTLQQTLVQLLPWSRREDILINKLDQIFSKREDWKPVIGQLKTDLREGITKWEKRARTSALGLIE